MQKGGSIQKYDAGSGKYVDEPVKVVVKGPAKSVGIGKFEPGKKMEPETKLEVYYLKMWQNGKEMAALIPSHLNVFNELLGNIIEQKKLRSNTALP